MWEKRISIFCMWISVCLGLPRCTVVKNLPANDGGATDSGSIPGSGKSPRGGNGNPLQYFFLGNPVDRGVWWGYSPQGCKELDTTEWLSTYTHIHVSKDYMVKCLLFHKYIILALLLKISWLQVQEFISELLILFHKIKVSTYTWVTLSWLLTSE